jgi:hypothetical protein
MGSSSARCIIARPNAEKRPVAAGNPRLAGMVSAPDCSLHKSDGNPEMDMDRNDWDLDFEDDADESELDDAFEMAADFEEESSLLNQR